MSGLLQVCSECAFEYVVVRVLHDLLSACALRVCVCEGSPPVSSIVAAPAGEGMRLGAFANTNIAAEDVYLSVPLPLIMDLDSGYR